MIRLLLLLPLVWSGVGALISRSPTPTWVDRVILQVPATACTFAPLAPTPSQADPGPAAKIVADEIEREDRFKAFVAGLEGTEAPHERPLLLRTHQFSHPPSGPIPWVLSPRFRC